MRYVLLLGLLSLVGCSQPRGIYTYHELVEYSQRAVHDALLEALPPDSRNRMRQSFASVENQGIKLDYWSRAEMLKEELQRLRLEEQRD